MWYVHSVYACWWFPKHTTRACTDLSIIIGKVETTIVVAKLLLGILMHFFPYENLSWSTRGVRWVFKFDQSDCRQLYSMATVCLPLIMYNLIIFLIKFLMYWVRVGSASSTLRYHFTPSCLGSVSAFCSYAVWRMSCSSNASSHQLLC